MRPCPRPGPPPPAKALWPVELCFRAVHLYVPSQVDQKAVASGLLLARGILGRCSVALTLIKVATFKDKGRDRQHHAVVTLESHSSCILAWGILAHLAPPTLTRCCSKLLSPLSGAMEEIVGHVASRGYLCPRRLILSLSLSSVCPGSQPATPAVSPS